MSKWLDLAKDDQIELFNQIGAETGLQPFSIEKDAWVTLVLRILFRSKISDYIVFKGGTSLSKAYGLIERFSEDIDFSISREYLGFCNELTKGQIRKLRRASHKFSLDMLPDILFKEFTEYGVKENLYQINVPNVKISDQDPEIIHINYASVFEEDDYLQSRVLIEMGARSLMEPFDNKNIESIIDARYPESEFTEGSFQVQTVIPEKTILEKLILLHEEFQKEPDKIRYYRMSRHLYDIYQIMKTDYGERAIKDNVLFEHICAHRKKFTPARNVNYQELRINNLNFIPPDDFIDLYRSDYKEMQSAMIYGDSLEFEKLIEELMGIL